MSNWAYIPPMNVGQPGAPVVGGGGQGLTLQFRDPLDARRAMAGFIPSADYPDGYLGTIQSRREDRLLNSLKARLNDRAYQRGVHKGEKVDVADYIWPPEFGPMTGLERQARTGLRAAPLMTAAEQLGLGQLPRGAAGMVDRPPNPQVRGDLRRLGPSWK